MSSPTSRHNAEISSSDKKQCSPPSRSFLSGDGDENFRSQQKKGLEDFLLVGSQAARDFENDVTSSSNAERIRRFCIEVVGESSNECDVKGVLHFQRDVGESSDDDEPPPILSKDETVSLGQSVSGVHKPGSNMHSESLPVHRNETVGRGVGNDDTPSLMEEMVNEAEKALKEKSQATEKSRRKEARLASFGMKKGFLNSIPRNSPTKKVKSTNVCKSSTKKSDENVSSTKAERKKDGFLNSARSFQSRSKVCGKSKIDLAEEEFFELDSDGNIVKASDFQAEEIPTIRPKERRSHSPGRGLRLEEVQEAMVNNPADKFLGCEWVTDSLLQKISENPRLAAGLSNPRFTEALQDFQKNPKEAMTRYRSQSEIFGFLHEFCGLMGEHFIALGDEQDKMNKKTSEQSEASLISPLVHNALKRQSGKTSKDHLVSDNEMSREERDKVDFVLADKNLTTILMDPDMQRVIQECALPGRMRSYMHHSKYGPKLRSLISAGLLKVEL